MAKHFMIYYQKGTGTFVVTGPKPWARENQHYFPNYNFQGKNIPTTGVIETWLINNRNFQRVVDNEDFSLIQNLDTNIEL